MHRNPLKRAKPVRSSAAATPGANLPQGLGKEQRPGLQHGDGKEQATTCEVAVRSMYFVVEEGLLKRLGAGNRKYPGPQPRPQAPSPACTAASGVLLHLAPQSATHH
jgi:hypothetical protein